MLQLRNVFQRMQWNYTIIMVSGQQQKRRILSAIFWNLDVVQRGISDQKLDMS